MSEGRTSLKNTGENKGGGRAANFVALKPKALAAEGKTGIVAQGVFERVDITAEGKYKGSKSYFIRDLITDTLYIVNGTKVLNDQMEQLDPADATEVEIAFNGMRKSKTGTEFYDWEVFVRDN